MLSLTALGSVTARVVAAALPAVAVVAPTTGLPTEDFPAPAVVAPAAHDVTHAAGTAPVWEWPLRPRPQVVHPFAAPDGPYGRGHRGIDLSSEAGRAVRAVAAGEVTHVGVIAGRGTVSVSHASGLRSTYEPVVASVREGETVEAGDVLGRLGGSPGHCAPAACLHLGAIDGDGYTDPLPLLGDGRIILLPLG